MGRTAKVERLIFTVRQPMDEADAFKELVTKLATASTSPADVLRRFVSVCVAEGDIPAKYFDDGRTEEELFHIIEEAELAKKILAARNK